MFTIKKYINFTENTEVTSIVDATDGVVYCNLSRSKTANIIILLQNKVK